MNIREIDREDILLWPDGTWCYRHQQSEMSQMSDDFQVVPFDTPEHDAIVDG